MRYSGTWLRPEDEALLEYLRDHGPATASELQERADLGFSDSYLDQRCSKLVGWGGLLARAGDAYHLTRRGEDYLEGELDPEVVSRG